MKEHDAADATDSCRLICALADGEADAADLGRGCELWATDVTARERWHAYHLIGDVLRSQDLAHRPQHDQDFLRRLSARLQAEPVLLAPSPLRSGPGPARRAWALPAALAAGVMALATTVGLWSTNQGDAAAPKLALAPAAVPAPHAGPPNAPLAVPPTAALAAPPNAPLMVAAPAPSATAVAEAIPVGGRVLRDAQLDRYLRAHRDYAAALPGSLPGGSGRSMATVSFER